MGSLSAERQGRGEQPAGAGFWAAPAAHVAAARGWLAGASAAAWLAGFALAAMGAMSRWWDRPAWLREWLGGDAPSAAAYLLLLVLGCVFWWAGRRRAARAGWSRCRRLGFCTRPGPSGARAGWFEWLLAGTAAVASIATSIAVANIRVGGESQRFGSLPPAYHDEYSYLFQARTFLAGRTWFPTHPESPQFFDQMHVLNDDGRFASRYFPGTGVWLAPFVAVDRPYWGHWLGGGLIAFFVFWSGRELAGNGVGLLAGLLTALAPGSAIFSNLLLAHHPALAGLSGFLYAFLRMLRTQSTACAFFAGCGLAFAMLCRPMTAAGFGLPFGIWFAVWLWSGRDRGGDRRRRLAAMAAMAVPLVAAFSILFLYNRSITGSGWRTPYAVYGTIYAPRQAYGFYNVERGTPRVGPKVRTAYDEWAENLTPARAARNAGRRLVASWEWSLGIVPLAMGAAAFPFCTVLARRHGWFDRRWWLIPAAIASLHLAHVPYWFTGIMHWHYVFESGTLWLLLFAGVSAWLLAGWSQAGRGAVAGWWACLLVLAVGASWLPTGWLDPLSEPAGAVSRRSRVGEELSRIAYSRLKYERFHREVEWAVRGPAVVFVDPNLEDAHIEYVVNRPDLSGPILYARLMAPEFERDGVLAAFGERAAYWVVADDRLRTRLMTGDFSAYRFQIDADLELREPRPVELWAVSPREAPADLPMIRRSEQAE
jgi:hypothetical protein